MKVLFDLNVLLDLFLDREPWANDAKTLVACVLAGKADGFVCAIDIPTLFYIARKTVRTAQALVTVRRCLETFDVLPVGRSVLEAALQISGDDYEDNVHAAAASQGSLDAIVTRDPAGFTGTAIPILSPAEAVARLGLPKSGS